LFELSILLGCLFGYLFGSVLFAQIISKLFLKKNIRQYGSFNPGSTNLTRISNRYFGMMASILDGSKGILTIVFT
jgi:glycerol-3-phosphate acyltransferase PlsY